MGAQSSDTSRSLPWKSAKSMPRPVRRRDRRSRRRRIPGPRGATAAEAGEGVAEGFELAEDDLIKAAETARAWVNPFTPEVEARDTTFDYSEADHEGSSEFLDSDK